MFRAIKAIFLCAALLLCGTAVASNAELSAHETEFVDDFDLGFKLVYEARIESTKLSPIPAEKLNLLLNLPRATEQLLESALKSAERKRYKMKARKKAIALTILEDLSSSERASLYWFPFISAELRMKIVLSSLGRLGKSGEANMPKFFDNVVSGLGTPKKPVYFQLILSCDDRYGIELFAKKPVFEGKKSIYFESCGSGFPADY